MLTSKLAPTGAKSLALGLGVCCFLGAACLSTEHPSAAIPGPTVTGDVTYTKGAGVALEWIARDTVAMVADGQLCVVDFSGDQPTQTWLGLQPVAPVMDYNDGRLVILTTEGYVYTLDTETWEVANTVSTFGTDALDAGGRLLALGPIGEGTAYYDGKLLVWFTEEWGMPHKHSFYPEHLVLDDIEFGLDGRLYAFSEGWTMSLGRSGDPEWSAPVPFAGDAGRNRFSWDKTSNLYGAYRGEAPLSLEVQTPEFKHQVELGYRGPVTSVVSRDGTRVVTSTYVTQAETFSKRPAVHAAGPFGMLTSFDATTGNQLHIANESGQVLGLPGLEWRSAELGLAMAALGQGGLASIDGLKGREGNWQRLSFRGPDLELVEELVVEPGIWPIALTAGGDLIAVCFPENRIEIYQLENGYRPVMSVAEDSEVATMEPIVTFEISSLDGAPVEIGMPAAEPRLVFALREDGDLIAMTGPDGNVTFGNPRTGWPNQIVSIRLPRDSGIPLAIRFRGAGAVDGLEGEMVVTARLATGALVEWTLNPELSIWSEAKPIAQRYASSSNGGVQAHFRLGQPGNVEVREPTGELLWREFVGPVQADAIVTGPDGSVVFAADGKLTYLGKEE